MISGSPGNLTDVVINRNKITGEETTENIAIVGNTDVLIMNNFIGSNASPYSLNGIITYGSIANGNVSAFIEYNTFALLEYGLNIDGFTAITAINNIFTQISNVAIYDNGPTTNTLDINNNLFHNNVNDGIRGMDYFSGDPLLVDAANGDFHIQVGSAAIDKVFSWQGGIDIDGQIRGIGILPNSFDVGADEFIIYTFLPLVER
jgi:hypothetical protein